MNKKETTVNSGLPGPGRTRLSFGRVGRAEQSAKSRLTAPNAAATKCLLFAIVTMATALQCAAIEFAQHPADQVANVGTNVSFTVNLKPGSYVSPVAYQWYFQDVAIDPEKNSSATNRILRIANAQVTDSGRYFAVATDATASSATSQVARLSVTIPQFEQVNLRAIGITNVTCYSWSAAWGDYDGDGYVDLYVANTASDGHSAYTNFLYHNNGDGTFTRKFAPEVGPIASDKDPSAGCAWADINNDGALDLLSESFVPTVSSPSVTNRVYLYQADGTFISADAGDLTKPVRSGYGTLGDYDNDGWLDFFAVAAVPSWTGQSTNLLFHGNPGGTFTMVTEGVIVADEVTNAHSNEAEWGDYDNDGDLDLFVANWHDKPFFYRNDGNGNFTRILAQSQSALAKTDLANQAWGDYDNDGFLDLAIGSGGVVILVHNNRSGDFELVTTWSIGGASIPIWTDYDNDGYLDMIVFHGQSGDQTNVLYRNNGDGTFSVAADVITKTASTWIKGAWGDYDNDGFPDLFVIHTTGQNALYHNVGSANGNTNHWIKFKLNGTASNRSAIGAKVRVRATIGGKTFWQLREISGGQWCQNDLHPNFGLGDATKVEVARIEWPSGIVQELYDVAANQILTITEHQDIPQGTPRPQLGVSKVAGAPAKLTLTGQTNLLYVFETSTDLVNWAKLAVRKNETGTVEYNDELYTSDARRFYRAVAP